MKLLNPLNNSSANKPVFFFYYFFYDLFTNPFNLFKSFDTQFIEAVKANHIRKVQHLLAKGYKPNLTTKPQSRLLHLATQAGYYLMVELLLELGADPNGKNDEEKTPLMLVLAENVVIPHSTQISLTLLQNGADFGVFSANRNLLMEALKERNWDLARALVEKGHNINLRDMNGCTPLHQSANDGDNEKTKVLIGLGFNPNAKDHNDRTPLHYAAQEGFDEVVSTLIRADAFLNEADGTKRTPLHLAARQDHPKVVRALLQARAAHTLKDKDGQTALHLAVQFDNIYVVNVFAKEKGLNLDTLNKESQTALAIAFAKDNIAMVAALGNAGASLKPLAKYDPLTLMIKIISINAIDFLKVLKSNGYSLNPQDKEGLTLLHHIVKRRPTHLEASASNLIEDLIDLKADPTSKDHFGRTPMHYVQNPMDAKILKNNGCKIDGEDKEKLTPLFHAARNHLYPVCEYLIREGADPLRSHNQRNILHYIKERPNREFSKKIKPLINLPPHFTLKTRAFLEALLAQSMTIATLQRKKLLIVVGESHGNYKHYQVEKMIMQIANRLKIPNLLIELKTMDIIADVLPSYLPLRYSRKHLQFKIIGSDNNRSTTSADFNGSKEGMLFRNFGMSEMINNLNQPGLLITGADHLHGVLEASTTCIDLNRFFILPINLASNDEKATHAEAFRNHQEKAIQFSEKGFSVQQAKTAVRLMNNLKQFEFSVEVVRETKEKTSLPTQSHSTSGVVEENGKKYLLRPRKGKAQ